MGSSTSGSPNGGRGADRAIFTDTSLASSCRAHLVTRPTFPSLPITRPTLWETRSAILRSSATMIEGFADAPFDVTGRSPDRPP